MAREACEIARLNEIKAYIGLVIAVEMFERGLTNVENTPITLKLDLDDVHEIMEVLNETIDRENEND